MKNFDGRVTAALLRRSVDIVRVQDAGLRGVDDPALLAWAASAGRILLTHDRKTMSDFARDRLVANEPMPGVVVVATTGSIQDVIDFLLIFDGASVAGEYEGQVVSVP